METEQITASAHPPLVTGRAVMQVERLDDRGEAVGHVERWLALPSAKE